MTISLSLISEISAYYKIFSEYTDTSTIILWGIIGALLGFTILLVAEIILRKKILVRRRFIALKVLAFVYMAFFPLFGAFCSAQWAATHTFERQAIRNIPKLADHASDLFGRHIKDAVISVVAEEHLEQSCIDLFGKGVDIAGKFVGEQLKFENPGLNGKLMALLAQTDYVKDKVVDKMVEGIAAKLPIHEDVVRRLLNTNFNNLMDDGIISSIIANYVKMITGGLKSNILLIFAIGMGIPLVEILIANRMAKKRKDSDCQSGANIE